MAVMFQVWFGVMKPMDQVLDVTQYPLEAGLRNLAPCWQTFNFRCGMVMKTHFHGSFKNDFDGLRGMDGWGKFQQPRDT